MRPDASAWPAWLRNNLGDLAVASSRPATRLAALGVPFTARFHLALLAVQPAVGLQEPKRLSRYLRAALGQAAAAGFEPESVRKAAGQVRDQDVAVPQVHVTDDLLAVAWTVGLWVVQVGAYLYRCKECDTIFLWTGHGSIRCGRCKAPPPRSGASGPPAPPPTSNGKTTRAPPGSATTGASTVAATPARRRSALLAKPVARRAAPRRGKPMGTD